MKILISGSTGLVGSALISFLEQNHHELHKLVRNRAGKSIHPGEIVWDPLTKIINSSLLEGFDVVVHLSGENIIGRWTEEKKKRIKESRVLGTDVLCETLSQLRKPPQVLICASAIGYYGNRGEECLTEQSSKGEGFLATVCNEWEEATRAAAQKGIRVVNLRIGMVLSPKGGALKQMLPIFRLGLGGKIGSGHQYISWVALHDLVRIIVFAIHQENLAGPVNAVSPFAVTNQEFTKTLGKILHRPTFLSMPAVIVKVIFGEMGKETLLTSERVEPKKLEKSGFEFQYPTLDGALQAMID